MNAKDITDLNEVTAYWASCLTRLGSEDDLKVAYDMTAIVANDRWDAWYNEGKGDPFFVEVFDLVADLEILRGRLRQKLLPESEQARYWSIDSECRVLRQDLEDVRQHRAQLTTRLDHARTVLLDTQKKLQSQGGDRFKQRERLSEEKAKVAASLASTHQRQLRRSHVPASP